MKKSMLRYPAEPRALEYIPEGAVFIDIETTGLKKETDMISLLGCGTVTDGLLCIVQWFNDDGISEEDILKDFLKFLEKHPGPLITFNGGRFDLPFLRAHLCYNELVRNQYNCPLLDNRDTLDLYILLRRFAPLFSMKKASQKAWEEHMGIHRLDTLSGHQAAVSYREYLRTKKKEYCDPILDHNAEDIRYLAAIPALLSYRQFEEGRFSLESMEEGRIRDRSAILFHIRLACELYRPLFIENKRGILSAEGTDLLLSLPVYEGKMYHYYPDHKDYFYLPAEDRAVHKSIGKYVDPDHRTKAVKENCYIPVESVFLPGPWQKAAYGFNTDPCLPVPAYGLSYEDRADYFNLDDLLDKGKGRDILNAYLRSQIQCFFLDRIRREKKK